MAQKMSQMNDDASKKLKNISDIGGVDSTVAEKPRPFLSGIGYQKLRRTVVLVTAFVAIVPLIIMTVINYNDYTQALQSQEIQSISRLLTNNKRTLEFHLSERRSALLYIGREHTFSELCDPGTLGQIIRNMNDSFSLGMFVDLGIVDSTGRQLCYNGPYSLQGRNYTAQDWYYRAVQRGMFTSDVFLGHRRSPHFAIATRHARDTEDYYLLRATFDAEALSRQIHTAGLYPRDDIFLITSDGVLQTKSRRYGKILTKIPLDLPHESPGVEVIRHQDEHGDPIFLGYANIADSPFILTFVRPFGSASGGWAVPARLFVFLVISAALVLGVILWGSGQFLNRLRSENLRRAALMHKAEYSNKLASIGRLAAGVAHEINNPLSIINEKSGLIKDHILLGEKFPHSDKFLNLIDSVLDSVARCKTITHRLLGFAKHMDVKSEVIDVPVLVNEVLGFLGKETEYRGIRITVNSHDDVPNIDNDRGQIQQVLLNLVNNAVSAVNNDGHIDIEISRYGDNWISIAITDDGIGIAEDDLQRIFEPFFTTKEGAGTGLGLSITYGIIQKLGGKISVESHVGKGTCFTILLPINRKD